MSMKPGATVSPDASIRRAAVAVRRSPMAAMRSPRMPTSARTAGVPSPLSTEPPAIRRSYGCCAAGCAQAEPTSSAATSCNADVTRMSDLGRCDVLVHAEQISGIPCPLDLGEAREVLAVCGLHTVAAFVFREEVDVGAAGREPAEILPRRTRPLDVERVLFGTLPGAGDV